MYENRDFSKNSSSASWVWDNSFKQYVISGTWGYKWDLSAKYPIMYINGNDVSVINGTRDIPTCIAFFSMKDPDINIGKR